MPDADRCSLTEGATPQFDYMAKSYRTLAEKKLQGLSALDARHPSTTTSRPSTESRLATPHRTSSSLNQMSASDRLDQLERAVAELASHSTSQQAEIASQRQQMSIQEEQLSSQRQAILKLCAEVAELERETSRLDDGLAGLEAVAPMGSSWVRCGPDGERVRRHERGVDMWTLKPVSPCASDLSLALRSHRS